MTAPSVLMADDEAARRRRIADEASAWFARRDAGAMSETDQQAMQSWLDADPRHRATFDKLGALWSGLAATPREARAQAAQALRDRRGRDRRIVMGGLLAVVGLGGLAGLLGRRPAPEEFYATKIGERRTVDLADGSTLQLNSATTLTVEMTGKYRRIRLKSGEAAFEVAADPTRPFVVESGGGSATALGTAYLVRAEGDQTIITVLEHAVDLRYPIAASASRRLSAGQQVRYGRGRISEIVNVDPFAASAWQQGQIMVEDRPVAEVVAEIGRYTPRPIRLEGTRVRARRVSGVFPTDDPMAALKTLGEQLGLSVTSQPDGSILVR